MTNWEHYNKEIKEIIENGSLLAITDNEPKMCSKTRCSNCDFDNENLCRGRIKEWLNAEHCEFKKGELVEVSIDGTDWVLRYFCRIEENLDNEKFLTFAWGYTSEETETLTKWKYCRKYGTLGGLINDGNN